MADGLPGGEGCADPGILNARRPGQRRRCTELRRGAVELPVARDLRLARISVADPKKRGRDRVEIRSAKVSADGKTVTLEVPGLAPVMQMQVKMNIKSA